ncbi:MAG: type I-U CRISPR-associated helicase/endonuclease Cas3 [Planctomycetaceae bacterium]|nr:type I-U CRISPR-associated helicase/endonuclease Cas3 [Planctomycetaceae bacterium]
MSKIDFDTAFKVLTGNDPFPWQKALYERFISDRSDNIPSSCNLPTGLGKTSVIAVWLISLTNHPDKMPRRLVYVVNRRTVVDQTTDEVEKYRNNREKAGIPEELAISTLRGQFADNREWSADPSRPAVICGTVDMIGSRLLFSGYGCGFKSRPLHAGFLGQDVLLIHDEAHLEPAFQKLIEAIEHEQKRCKDIGTFRVMELTATSRGQVDVFSLSAADKEDAEVKRRINAEKSLVFHTVADEKKPLADKLLSLCNAHKDSKQAILVFVRTVDTLNAVVSGLRQAKHKVQQLTGTLRGLERNDMADPRDPKGCPIFARFLPKPRDDADERERWKIEPEAGTVFLVCTSAGEVGVNISADHLVCDLSPFESMAQRFGRVNRFGRCVETRIDIVVPAKFDGKDYDNRREATLALLRSLDGNGSPAALGGLDADARIEAFSPPPTILPVSDFLFDSWALTTIRDRLPGRPNIEPYLHGLSTWEPPQTKVAWREEVWELRQTGETQRELKRFQKYATELLEDYPLKNHELLRDRTDRVLNALKKLNAPPETPVWILDDEDRVEVTTLGEVIEGDKDDQKDKTILLPPQAGGLEKGLLDGASKYDPLRKDYDVADEWFGKDGQRLRKRIWDDDDVPEGMSIVDTIDTRPNTDDSEQASGRRYWHRCALDVEENKNSKRPVAWTVHVANVLEHAEAIVKRLKLSDQFTQAVKMAARFHDHGKRRAAFQKVLGNFKNAEPLLAKSGTKNRNNQLKEDYRHEFGSLVDLEREPDFQNLPDEDTKELIRHLIAVHHGYGRPHFPKPFDPEHSDTAAIACEVPRRFARLQRKYGRWGLAYLESLLRAADWAASGSPSEFLKEGVK